MEKPDLSLSPACRILVVSRDLAHCRELVNCIRVLTSSPLEPRADDDSFVEWTIKNKYYTAPVHLLLHQTSKLPAKPLWPPETDEERVPALVFVFRKGEAYRDTFLSMHEAYTAHDPEVALAVALPPLDINLPLDSGGADEFFSEHNFEYIDAQSKPGGDGESEYDGAGLPRILEALNVIMWPSMVRTPHGGLRRTIPSPDLSGSDLDTFDQSFATVSDTVPPYHPTLFDVEAGPSTQSLAELNAWLDDDASWAPPSDGPLVSDGTTIAQPRPSGFEDDFSEFLSAPPIGEQNNSPLASSDIQTTMEQMFRSDEDAPEEFDLSSLLSGLEAMRAEISEITDPEARRNAAARVALSLAAGLGLDDSDGNELDEELLQELRQT